MKTKILVTLATGKTGFETARQLLGQGYAVKALVREQNEKTQQLEQMGAELVFGSFDDYEKLKLALTDVQAAYYCYPFKKGLINDLALFIKAAKEMKTPAIVFMGQWLAQFDDQKSIHTLSVKKAYRMLDSSGLNVVYFIPGYFVENTISVFLENAVQLRIFTSPFGNGKNPVVSNEDMAATLVALLKNPAPYYGKYLRPTGPQSLSAKDMAKVVSKVIGKKVWVINLPEWLFIKAASTVKKQFGFTDFTLSQAIEYNLEFRKNTFDVGGATNVVKELTGKDPEDFETIVRRLIHQSATGKPSLKGGFNALLKFLLVPFQPAPSRQVLAQLNS